MNYEERKAWLEGLKEGDRVAVSSGYGYRDYSIYKIDRLTKTQIVIRNNKYWRKDGRFVGSSSSYRTVELQPVTAKVVEAVDRGKFASVFYEYNKLAESLPISTVRKLLAVLDEGEQQGKEGE